jgi:hypothetical protein
MTEGYSRVLRVETLDKMSRATNYWSYPSVSSPNTKADFSFDLIIHHDLGFKLIRWQCPTRLEKMWNKNSTGTFRSTRSLCTNPRHQEQRRGVQCLTQGFPSAEAANLATTIASMAMAPTSWNGCLAALINFLAPPNKVDHMVCIGQFPWCNKRPQPRSKGPQFWSKWPSQSPTSGHTMTVRTITTVNVLPMVGMRRIGGERN